MIRARRANAFTVFARRANWVSFVRSSFVSSIALGFGPFFTSGSCTPLRRTAV